MDLYLIGGGGHCVSCVDVIELEGKYKIKGIFDQNKAIGEKILGIPVVGNDSKLNEYVKPGNAFLITVGQIKTPQVRIEIFNKLKELKAEMATVVSPRAHISKHAKMGKGTIVMHDVLVNANAVVGNNCILNTKSLIEHDAIVEDHCHISTAAVLNGNCKVSQGSFVGSNAVLKEGLIVPENSVLKAGEFHK